jgi:hypothetical protein
LLHANRCGHLFVAKAYPNDAPFSAWPIGCIGERQSEFRKTNAWASLVATIYIEPPNYV